MKHSKKKKRRVNKQNQLQVRLIFTIVCIVFCAMLFNSHRIRMRGQEYAAEEAELDMQIAEAQAENKELSEQQDYRKTDAYKEQVAREQFGMVKEGEYALKEREEGQ